MNPTITPGKYLHFKGNLYRITGIAKHSETLEEYVIYYPEKDGPSALWCRPLRMFTELVIDPQGNETPRFKRIDD